MNERNVSITKDGICINGKEEILLAGSIFYFRLPRATWEKRIADLKKLGYNAVDIYFPWNYHEVEPGKFDFDGEKDVRDFLQLMEKYNMYVVARPGPYICSEWTGGSLPARILGKNDILIRTNDEKYLKEVDSWYNAIIPVLAEYEIGKKGTVICVQLENELDFFDCSDVDGYISHLRDSARSNGLSVPVICCAGQGSLQNCGGLVDGVVGTYNFYPGFDNVDFELNCYRYKQALQKRDLPLLVTETHRDHYVLRRELLAGAKLLGAYNQVSGTNFEFYSAINNWGHGDHPESYITSDYDFGGVITSFGDYTEEADKAILFSCGLKAYSESLAKAESILSDDIHIQADFLCPAYHGLLLLAGSGLLMGLTNCSEHPGIARVKAGKYEFSVEIAKQSTVMLPLDVTVDGITICYSNAELIRVGKQLMLYTDGNVDACIKFDGKTVTIQDFGSYLDGKLLVVNSQAALEAYRAYEQHTMHYSVDRKVTVVENAVVGRFPQKLFDQRKPLFDAANNGQFQKRYAIGGIPGKELFLQQISDWMSAWSDGQYLYSKSMAGRDLLLPANGSGRYQLNVEQWGYCNFDDPRRKALYLQTQRGVRAIYSVEEKAPLYSWRFQVYNAWLPEKLHYIPSDFDALLSVNSWNSTRLPLLALYYTSICRRSDCTKIFFVMENNVAESALYINGKLVGEISAHTNSLDITEYAYGTGKLDIAVLVRKREWTQPCGDPCILYAKDAEVCVQDIWGKDVAAAIPEDAQEVPLPVYLENGETRLLEIDMSRYDSIDYMGFVSGCNYKLTVAMNGKVIARLIDPNHPDVVMQGGDPLRFYIPCSWRNADDDKLTVMVESIGDGCSFSLSLESNE